jgi:hypothetical protein
MSNGVMTSRAEVGTPASYVEDFELQVHCIDSLFLRGGPKNNRNLNVARELEVVARCADRCRESTQYSSSLPLGVSLG